MPLEANGSLAVRLQSAANPWNSGSSLASDEKTIKPQQGQAKPQVPYPSKVLPQRVWTFEPTCLK